MIQRFSRLPKRKKNILLKRFIREDTAKAAAIEAGVNRNTANLYFNHFRELIFDYTSRAPRFSGEVEMDQSVFGKGVKREKYDKRVMANRRAYGDIWRPGTYRKKLKKKRDYKIMVFGILRRGGDVYTHIIKKADHNTLFPIIHLVVEPGTTIYTDKWQGFNGLKIDGYEHKPVNHALGPVGRDGAHTGNIDSFWAYSKRLLGRFRGISRRTFILHVKECEFRRNHKEDLEKVMKRLLQA